MKPPIHFSFLHIRGLQCMSAQTITIQTILWRTLKLRYAPATVKRELISHLVRCFEFWARVIWTTCALLAHALSETELVAVPVNIVVL